MDAAKTRLAGRFRPLRRMSDDDLAAAAAGGDQRAFGVIFERYHAPLYRYSAGILCDSELAADALQRTTLAAMSGLKGEERSIALKPWLYRIAHDESMSLLGGRSDDEPAPDDALDRLGGAPEVDNATRARLTGLLAGLSELPEQERSALLLRELNGLEYAEVGAVLEITSSAARQAVCTARRSLQAVDGEQSTTCDEMQTEISASDRRFQRRQDIREHLDGCADCSAFAAALAQRPRDLQVLFALPPEVAAAVLGAGRAAIGDDGERDAERRRHRALVAFLVLAVALASTAALAALGTFDSGNGGGRGGRGPEAPTPVQVAPLPQRPGSGGSGGATGGRKNVPALPGGTNAANGAGASSGTSAPASASAVNGASTANATSAASAYSTSGERIQGALGAGGSP